MEEKENKDLSPKKQDVSELDICKKERDEYLDGWKRAKADFINYKKEEVRRLEEAMKFGNEVLLREIIIVLDSFHIAIDAQKNEAQDKGSQIILGQLEEMLKRFGLEKIVVNPGDSFRPDLHEALQEIDSDKPVGSIASEVSKGYTLYGKVIRPTRVNISKSPQTK